MYCARCPQFPCGMIESILQLEKTSLRPGFNSVLVWLAVPSVCWGVSRRNKHGPVCYFPWLNSIHALQKASIQKQEKKYKN